jgi:hypothetical protein
MVRSLTVRGRAAPVELTVTYQSAAAHHHRKGEHE